MGAEPLGSSLAERPGAFWCRIPSRPNLGDALGPWLVRRITGREPVHRDPDGAAPHVLVTGSTIDRAGPASVVWGAGIMDADDDVDPRADIRAVRGPRTAARVGAGGGRAPDAIGDPALLLPRFHHPPVTATDRIGLVAHMADRPRLLGADALPPGIALIDVQGPVEAVVDEIRRCALVASSSLHGLIVAHAYGIDATWVEVAPLPSGDRSKFHDYLESIGRPGVSPVAGPARSLGAEELRRHAIAPPTPADIDLDALWDACPLRDGRWTALVS